MLSTGKGTVALVEEPQLIYLPLWRESLLGVDYAKLKASGVYYGFGVPRGRGVPVVVVPGFLGCDAYLFEFLFWLRRMGYRPYRSRIGYNAECPNLLTRRLVRTVNRACLDTGQKVHLVGHSLGGVLARAAAYQAPEKVLSVTTLASPFRGVRINPFIAKAVSMVRHSMPYRHISTSVHCFTSACTCGFPDAMRGAFPDHIQQCAVYTRSDGVVDWRTCIHNDEERDIEVTGTHCGLTWNPKVYRIVGDFLAGAAETKADAAAKTSRGRKSGANGKTSGNGHAAKGGDRSRTRRRPARQAFRGARG